MPKAAVDEYCRVELLEYYVWPARQALGMKAISKPFSMKKPANRQLGLGILRFNRGHILSARL